MVISKQKNGRGIRPTSVDIPAFTMKVVQSEEDLFNDALRNGHGEPVLPMRSKIFQA